jgi:phage regulator Rha-like protein
VKWTSPENFTALNFTVRFTPRWSELEEKGRDEEREGTRK